MLRVEEIPFVLIVRAGGMPVLRNRLGRVKCSQYPPSSENPPYNHVTEIGRRIPHRAKHGVSESNCARKTQCMGESCIPTELKLH